MQLSPAPRISQPKVRRGTAALMLASCLLTTLLTGTNTTTASSEPVNVGGANANGNADPFAAQRTPDNDPFANQHEGDTIPDLATSPSADSPPMPRDRRMSKEWGNFILESLVWRKRRLKVCQMLPKFLRRGSRSEKGASMLLQALGTLTPRGAKTGTRASMRSSNRRCVLQG